MYKQSKSTNDQKKIISTITQLLFHDFYSPLSILKDNIDNNGIANEQQGN